MSPRSEVDLLAFVRSVLGDVSPVPVDHLEARTSFTDLGVDSVDLATMVAAIEDELDIVIPEDELVGVDTVRALAQVVGRHAKVWDT